MAAISKASRAASLAYFGKEPRQLVARRGGAAGGAAAVAGIAPARPLPAGRARGAQPRARPRRRRRRRAARRGRARQGANRCRKSAKPLPMLAPHAADQVVAAEPMHARPPADHRRRICRARLQELARDRAQALGPDSSVAILAVDNASGEVRARVGSADYFDARRAGQVDMTQALRSPGSTLKPFIYGLGFEDGLHPSRDADRRPAGALRQLRAGEFRSDLPGHGDRAPRAAIVAQRAGDRACSTKSASTA